VATPEKNIKRRKARAMSKGVGWATIHFLDVPENQGQSGKGKGKGKGKDKSPATKTRAPMQLRIKLVGDDCLLSDILEVAKQQRIYTGYATTQQS
jgi:hypothetical protein